VRIRNQEDAVAAYVSSLGGRVPDRHYVTASCIADLGSMLSDEDCLWSVGLTSDDEANWITGGRRTILGPDGKAWAFSNRNIRDPEIVKALTHLYIEGAADLVDPPPSRPSTGPSRRNSRSECHGSVAE
jgi:hypothetical protein